MHAAYKDKYKQEKMRELMTLIAKQKLTEQKMQIEKRQLQRDVKCHQEELAEYERKIEELQDEFKVEYAPNQGGLDFDDDYTD